MTFVRARRHWIAVVAWAIGLAIVLIGLGAQVRYAEAVVRCVVDDRLVLCSGPLPGWLMPVTVVAGLGLVAVGAARLVGIRREST